MRVLVRYNLTNGRTDQQTHKASFLVQRVDHDYLDDDADDDDDYDDDEGWWRILVMSTNEVTKKVSREEWTLAW